MKTDWVDCPICHESGMEATHYGGEDGWYINCVNLNCPSNQVGMRWADLERPPRPPKVIKGRSKHAWDQEPDRSVEPPDIDYIDENWSIRDNIFIRFFKKILKG